MTTFRDACLGNADDHIKAGRNLHQMGNVPHLVYHLAVLALEEIGKASIEAMGRIAHGARGIEDWGKNQLDDHEKKLFWALWGPTLTREKISPQQIEEHRGLAKRIHLTRLHSLYVSDEKPPREKVPTEESLNMLELAASILEIVRGQTPGEITPEMKERSGWLYDKISDVNERGVVLSGESMGKLQELGSAAKWIEWLTQKYDEVKRLSEEIMKRELSQSSIAGTKWSEGSALRTRQGRGPWTH
jgi:AbiV family abortive infection protein